MYEHAPDTQPSGALTPPPGHPPTALATSAPLPPRGPRARIHPQRRRGLLGLIDRALEGLDSIADRIATATGLR